MESDRVNDDAYIRKLTFTTKCFPDTDFIGKRATKYHELYLENESEIKLCDISVFLNEKSEYLFQKCK
jgi:hypothetical protein